MNDYQVPVLLLTGYLGSGKTTLLNRILTNKRNIKFAVIVNDIGEINIDAKLIAQGGVVGEGDDSLVPLQNGCICCTLKLDLVQQLNEIVSQRRFDYIVIEASGICEPDPIAQTIVSYPQLYPNLVKNGVARLDSIVTVVDALRLRDEFSCGNDLSHRVPKEEDLASLVIQQIEFCNTILLNKASEISKLELENVERVIREIQPCARIVTCDFCDVDLDILLNVNAFDMEKVATSAQWFRKMEEHIEDSDLEHPEHHHHNEHGCCSHSSHEHCSSAGHSHGIENDEVGEALEYGISTFVYQRRKPFNMVEFDQFIARSYPKNVIRSKGLCYFSTERDMCYLFEQAGKQVSLTQAGQWYATMPQEEFDNFKKENPSIMNDWDDTYGDRMQKIVFIGQNMNRDAIEKLLDDCLESK